MSKNLTRNLNKNRKDAQQLAARLKSRYTSRMRVGQTTEWEQLISEFGLKDVPSSITDKPCTYANLGVLTAWLEASAESRYKAQLTATEQQSRSTVIRTVEDEFIPLQINGVELLSGQHKVANAIYKSLFIDKITFACLQDGPTGSGKTYLALAVIKKVIDENLDRDYIKVGDFAYTPPHPIIVVTKKTVVEKWRRLLSSFDIPPGRITITSWSQLSAGWGKQFVTQEWIATQDGGETLRLHMKEAIRPFFVVLDESQGAKNRDSFQSKWVESCLDFPIYQLHLSATPFITVNNAMNFTLATRSSWMNMQLTRQNWSQFANAMADNPDKPSNRAAQRLRNFLSPYIFSMPPLRLKHKAINRPMLIDFLDDRQRELYAQSYERYLERRIKAGKDPSTGTMEKLVALLMFRKSAEFLRVKQLAKLAYESWVSGEYCPVVGVCFQDTLKSIVLELVDTYNVPRSEISLIWGGKKEIKQSDIATPDEIRDIINREVRGDEITAQERRKVQYYIMYMEDRTMHDEDAVAQRARYGRQSELGLWKQTPIERQLNIDQFLDGRKNICVFTLAAGSVGLDLDHQSEKSRPRRGFFTPCYNGEEFYQALGRTLRVGTLSDVQQFIVFFRGTIEERHVVPVLSSKLGALQRMIANRERLDYLLDKGMDEEAVQAPTQVVAECDEMLHSGYEDEENEDDDND